jgi:hypothetical protein
MKRHKKVLLAVLLGVVVLAGSIGGVVLAADDEQDDSTPPEFGSFTERVLEIYQEKTNTVIDREALRESIDQAREEMQAEHPRLRFHHWLFDGDELTEEQRADIEAWLNERPEIFSEDFKAWLESRPEALSDEFKAWLESRPDFLDGEFEEWFESKLEGFPGDFGLWGRLGPRIFGHMDRMGGFQMFGLFK